MLGVDILLGAPRLYNASFHLVGLRVVKITSGFVENFRQIPGLTTCRLGKEIMQSLLVSQDTLEVTHYPILCFFVM